MLAMHQGSANPPPSALPVGASASQPEPARLTGRIWVLLGIAATLIGLVMGLIMSTVGS